MSVLHQHFVFREARTVSELHALFQLRYRGYLESSCSSLVKPNDYGLEFDSFDWNAYHLGLFQHSNKREVPIGYMRLVQTRPTAMAGLVSSLASRFPEALLPDAPRFPLPLIASSPHKQRLLRLFEHHGGQAGSVAEGGRFVFAPEARAGGFARFVLEATIANTFYRYGFEYAMLACHPRHAPFYLRYGFKELEGGERNDYHGLSASVLGLSLSEVRKERAQRISDMGQSCQRFGSVALLPDGALPATAREAVRA